MLKYFYGRNPQNWGSNSKGQEIFVGKNKWEIHDAGGTVEKGEADIECLRRELKEEFGVDLASYKYLDTFEDPAALDPTKMVVMKVYLVEIRGEPKAQSEVDESMYVNSKTKGIEMGSIARDFVIPALVKRKLIE